MNLNLSSPDLKIPDRIQEKLSRLPLSADHNVIPGGLSLPLQGPFQHMFQLSLIHRLYQVVESLHIVGVKHIVPAGGEKHQHLVKGQTAAPPFAIRSMPQTPACGHRNEPGLYKQNRERGPVRG